MKTAASPEGQGTRDVPETCYLGLVGKGGQSKELRDFM